MEKITRETAFKPTLSKGESKADAISKAALAIIDQEVAAREEKTARLREARLAKEAADRAAESATTTRPRKAPKQS